MFVWNQYLRKDIIFRTKLLDSRDKRKIIKKVNPGLSATKLTSELYEETSKKVHSNTVRH